MAGQGTVSVKAFQKPLGQDEITALNAATTIQAGLTKRAAIPTYTNTAYIQAEGGNVRYSDDAANPPTAAFGTLLVDGAQLEYSGDLSLLKVIKASGAPKLNISFYK